MSGKLTGGGQGFNFIGEGFETNLSLAFFLGDSDLLLLLFFFFFTRDN